MRLVLRVRVMGSDFLDLFGGGFGWVRVGVFQELFWYLFRKKSGCFGIVWGFILGGFII